MRIDFIITELNIGGAERCLTELACGLAETGEDVRVFSIAPLPSGRSSGAQQASLLNRLHQQSIEVQSGEATSLGQAVFAYRRLAEFLHRSPPQVCQTFMYHANVMGTMAAKRNTDAICVGGLRVAENRRWRSLVETRAVAAMDSLVCVSQGVADFAQTRLACPDERCTVIPNAVDCTHFGASGLDSSLWKKLGWAPETELILFLGRMHPQKGLDLLQKQIEHLAPPNGNRRLLMIGDGPLSDSIDQWCQQIGRDRVQRLGFQSDVRSWIQMCHLLVLPSRYEGMPNVVLEAMASGKPVVAANVEGIGELLPSPKDQVFAIDDDETMRRRVDSILCDATLREKLGDENRSRVVRDFSIPSMIDSYRRLYRRLTTTRSLRTTEPS